MKTRSAKKSEVSYKTPDSLLKPNITLIHSVLYDLIWNSVFYSTQNGVIYLGPISTILWSVQKRESVQIISYMISVGKKLFWWMRRSMSVSSRLLSLSHLTDLPNCHYGLVPLCSKLNPNHHALNGSQFHSMVRLHHRRSAVESYHHSSANYFKARLRSLICSDSLCPHNLLSVLAMHLIIRGCNSPPPVQRWLVI